MICGLHANFPHSEARQGYTFRAESMSGICQKLALRPRSEAGSLFGGNAVLGRHDLPSAADLHPNIGHAGMLLVALAVGFAFLVIGARDNSRVAMHAHFT